LNRAEEGTDASEAAEVGDALINCLSVVPPHPPAEGRGGEGRGGCVRLMCVCVCVCVCV